MAVCEICGNDYDHAFEVRTAAGATHVFDCIECAAHALAPRCVNCGVRVLGHGVSNEHHTYCCASCARHAGVVGLVDTVESGS